MTMMERRLSLEEERLIEEMADEPDLEVVSKIAGFTDTRTLRKSMRRKPVQQALREGREAQIRGDLASLATKTLKDLMLSGSDAVRAKVAIWTLEAAGHGSKAEQEAEKPMTEMSPAELERFIAKQQELISGFLDSVPMKDVTPNNGAQQVIPAPKAPAKKG